MKSRDILIALAMILTFSSFLSGCEFVDNLIEKKAPETASVSKPSIPKRPSLEELAVKAVAVKKEVEINLSAKKEKGQVKVKITLNNPKQKPITSVQSWLSFDSSKLQGEKIDTSNSAFELMAPYDNAFDNESGLMMLGRSNSEPLTSASIEVAEVIFDVIADGTTMVDFYDYRTDLSGHTSVNTVTDGEPFNILIQPESPALIIEN